MRYLTLLNAFRIWDFERQFYGQNGDDHCGVFQFKSDEHPLEQLRVIASNGGGWEHVSVSLPNRCPTWTEMEQIKRLFFADHETAMQLHVPVSEHINAHNYCLHLWRPLETEIPRPPANMVA
jgi:hypothetical protein